MLHRSLTSLSFVIVSSLASLALGGCESRVALGETCVTDPECQSPYLCRAGRCRVECVDDSACGAAGRCVLVSPGVGGCAVRQEDAGPAESDARASDDAGADAGARFTRPQLCRSASECEGDSICDDDFGPAVCRSACDAHEDCPVSGVCDYYADDSGGFVQGCASLCLPGTDQGCPPATTCRMAFRSGMFLPAGPPSLTLCAGFSDDGREHCRCENLDSGGQCGAGLSCEQPEEGRMCLRMCEVGTMCTDTTRCERTPRSVIIDGVEYGVCPPTVAAPIDC